MDELGASSKNTILVLNKQDLVTSGGRINSIGYSSVCEISAVTGTGIDRLLEQITEGFKDRLREINLLIPYNEGWVLPYIYKYGQIINQEYLENGIQVKALVKLDKIGKLEEFILV